MIPLEIVTEKDETVTGTGTETRTEIETEETEIVTERGDEEAVEAGREIDTAKEDATVASEIVMREDARQKRPLSSVELVERKSASSTSSESGSVSRV